MRFIFITFLSVILLSSCANDAREKHTLKEMNKSFKLYIRDNDLKKDLITKLDRVDALSFELQEDDKREFVGEAYKAQVLMKGTSAYMNSSRIYNINDTVTCYFDENLKMLRLVNPNNPN